MKIGEIWRWRQTNGRHHVVIDQIEEYVDKFGETIQYVGYEYCGQNGELCEEEWRSGDTMVRETFIENYEKVYNENRRNLAR